MQRFLLSSNTARAHDWKKFKTSSSIKRLWLLVTLELGTADHFPTSCYSAHTSWSGLIQDFFSSILSEKELHPYTSKCQKLYT